MQDFGLEFHGRHTTSCSGLGSKSFGDLIATRKRASASDTLGVARGHTSYSVMLRYEGDGSIDTRRQIRVHFYQISGVRSPKAGDD